MNVSYLDSPIYETKNANSEAVAALFHQEMSGVRNLQDAICNYGSTLHDL